MRHETMTDPQPGPPSSAARTHETGFDALLKRRQGLDHRIAAARRRAVPDSADLVWMQHEALWLRCELERYDGLFRTLSRGRTGQYCTQRAVAGPGPRGRTRE